MDIFRVTARWTGFTGAPGYSNFYFGSGTFDGGAFGDEAQLLADRVATAFAELSLSLPSSVSVSIEPEVPVIDSDTGVIGSFNSIEPPPPVVGSQNDRFAGPVGAVVTWRTADVRAGRRIRGRTFLVPLVTTAFDDNGSLSTGTIDRVRAFADSLVGDALEGDLGVWSRPVGGSGGVFATVTGYTVPDLAAVLRSRRD